MPQAKVSVMERFERHISPEPMSGCWLWIGSVTNGYPQMRDESGKVCRVHRMMYELNHGPLPEGIIIRHKCDNPACVNPKHHEPGTPMDNFEDMLKRGRSKLHDEKVPLEAILTIRRLYATGCVPQKLIARMFGLSKSYIGLLSSGVKRFRDLKAAKPDSPEIADYVYLLGTCTQLRSTYDEVNLSPPLWLLRSITSILAQIAKLEPVVAAN